MGFKYHIGSGKQAERGQIVETEKLGTFGKSTDKRLLDQGCSSGNGEKPMDSGYVLKVEPTGFADRLDLDGKRNR